jgi:hypothetical protein
VENWSLSAIIVWFGLCAAFAIANFAAFVHHIVFCIQHHEYLLLIAGVILPFVGMIHGWGLWLGWFAS